MTDVVVQTTKLSKNFGVGESLTKVLRGLDIKILTGEFVIIFGPSGSGKSTLLNILNGLETPTSGEVLIDKQNINNLTDNERAQFHQKKIGMVFQAYNLIPSLSVMQNITLPLVFARVPKTERDRRVKKLLADFKLEKLAFRLPNEISGGQQQRVGIMRALINNPPIIVADEPTGNLDSVATHNVMDLFRSLNQEYHNTTLVVTHDQSLFRYADRIIHIVDGLVVKETVHKTNVRLHHPSKSIFDHVFSTTKSAKTKRLLQILANVLSNAQLAAFDEIELSRTIESFNKRIENKLTAETLYFELDRPQDEGGAGLYRSTARHLADNLETILGLLS